LIINELASNALKYAFVPSQKGKINIALHTEDSKRFTLMSEIVVQEFPKTLT
jgi:two-component sensor histidine kinase